MFRILIIDDNVKFILKVQKMLPSGSEWIASVDNDRIPMIIKKLLGSAVENKNGAFDHPFKKIIVLPDVLWRGRLRHALGGGGF